MGTADVSIAATALAIALVAFVTALGQLLQQYFATADGYRRCQRSVMGEWATRTRLRWRWREFRFETLYTTPEIFMTSTGPDRPDQVLIEGEANSRAVTLAPYPRTSPQGTRNINETVCWVTFLHQLHMLGARNGLCDTPGISLPALCFQERSWDFQLPDVVRPLAVCTVSDIAIMARRLGMRWKDFRPYDGSLKAEGHFHVMTSTNVRSLGILLQYSYTRNEIWRPALRSGLLRGYTKQKEERYIPSTGADLFGFGFISGNAGIHIPRFTIGTQDEIVTSLGLLDETGKSAIHIREILHRYPGFYPPTGDLVAMTMEMVRLRGRSHVQVPAPSGNMHGFSTSPKGRQAFRLCLEQFVTEGNNKFGPQTAVVLSACKHLSETWKEWETERFDSAEAPDISDRLMPAYLDAVHEQFDNLKQWIIIQKGPIYRNVLGAHIRRAIIYKDNDKAVFANWKTLNPNYEADVKEYFRLWPYILTDLPSGEYEDYDEKALCDIWIVMLFRACCWGACHFFVPGERVPSEYYGSQLPVYIG
ncbi:hypothetical protein LCER1_G007534 [Lachnellula cervina]|uniref:Uncharacterized protein n=1 Tax=Lachnellula cervina TaxID=1316786 RepID=A0A7D8YKR7_9HELO|nr:hypothetical protein LCER1_G007534 [Lachnellula cervina]